MNSIEFILTLYDDGDDDVPVFIFKPLLLFIAVLLCPLLLLLLLDFFSFRPFPLDSPLFCRELVDDDEPVALFVAAPIPANPPGNAKSAGCGNADKPDACNRLK